MPFVVDLAIAGAFVFAVTFFVTVTELCAGRVEPSRAELLLLSVNIRAARSAVPKAGNEYKFAG